MIVFLIYILVLIYIYEFYQYTLRLKTYLDKDDQETLRQLEPFTSKLDPYCHVLPENDMAMSENVLETPIYSHEALKQLEKEVDPLPADDTRAYHNPDFNIKLKDLIPDRPKRDPRWHCLRDYMICHSPYNFLQKTS